MTMVSEEKQNALLQAGRAVRATAIQVARDVLSLDGETKQKGDSKTMEKMRYLSLGVVLY